MTTLTGFPTISQLPTGTGYERPQDGYPDNNPSYNCGEACASMIRQFLTGVRESPDEIKDAVLSPGTVNAPSDMSQYAEWAASAGLCILRHTGSPSDLLAAVYAAVGSGHPVVCLIGSDWNDTPPTSASSHFVVFFEEQRGGAGWLTAKNPWGGFDQGHNDAWWQLRFRDGAVWEWSKAMLDLTQASAFYTQNADGSWTCVQTHQQVQGGILDFYRSMPAAGSLNGLTALGLPTAAMVHPSAGVWVQEFERGRVAYDPARTYDNPPGVVGDCYLAHVAPIPIAPPPPPVNVKAEVDALTAALNNAQLETMTLTKKLGSQAQ